MPFMLTLSACGTKGPLYLPHPVLPAAPAIITAPATAAMPAATDPNITAVPQNTTPATNMNNTPQAPAPSPESYE